MCFILPEPKALKPMRFEFGTPAFKGGENGAFEIGMPFLRRPGRLAVAPHLLRRAHIDPRRIIGLPPLECGSHFE